MARQSVPGERPLVWVGSSKADLLSFPSPVVTEFGNALGVAQFGGTHTSAKPWKGEGAGVFEIVENFDGNAYRAIYTVRFKKVVYVLHAFQKKSHQGIKTPLADVNLVKQRAKVAKQDYEVTYGKSEE
ncbi:MAG: type II toxin-antitoxin system RelE/ParE family toxin [Alphaproteobacteria bacterium]|nr:type II toxin-antitoxin system RelE/ParE family toxin [Alphaproteobacteria bacterium]